MRAIPVQFFADYSTRTIAAQALPQLTFAGIATISLLAGTPKPRPM